MVGSDCWYATHGGADRAEFRDAGMELAKGQTIKALYKKLAITDQT